MRFKLQSVTECLSLQSCAFWIVDSSLRIWEREDCCMSHLSQKWVLCHLVQST